MTTSNSNGKNSILTAALLSTSAILAQDANLVPVRYKDFGAKGDGKTDDHQAIIDAHNYANEHNHYFGLVAR